MRAVLFAVMFLWVGIFFLLGANSASGSEVNKKPKGADTKKSSNVDAGLKKSKPNAEEDRPWLIKERPVKKSDAPKKKPATLKWKNDEQRSQCETQLKKLQKFLDKTRTYSIRGDTCATTRNADGFLTLSDRLKNECPDGFLESNGYSEKIFQNVKVLRELGKKACQEK